MTEGAEEQPAVRLASASCPICRRPTVARYRPFCSKRCADVDLGRWVTESYRIPADPEDDIVTGEDR